MKTAIITLVAVTLLTGCGVPPQPVSLSKPEPIFFTKKQIAEVNDSALCSLSTTHPDPRIDAEIKSRKVDCETAALICAAKGVKKGTKQFSQCKENQRIQQASPAPATRAAGVTALATRQEPQCGFMQEFFGGRDCRGEEIQRAMSACETREEWVDKMQCKQSVPIRDPLDAEINAYIGVLIEK